MSKTYRPARNQSTTASFAIMTQFSADVGFPPPYNDRHLPALAFVCSSDLLGFGKAGKAKGKKLDLGAYIEELEKARERKRAALSPEDLREIVAELGWSEDDLAEIEAEVQAHIERARNYIAHDLWDNALSELRMASALVPTRLGIWTDLANAHFGRYQARLEPADLDAVDEYSHRCLELEPGHHASYALLAEVEKARKVAPKEATVGQKINLVAIALIFVVGLGAGVFVVMAPQAPQPAMPVEHHLPKIVEQIGGPKVLDVTPVTADAKAAIDVVFSAVPATGLTFVAKKIEQNDYDTGSFFAYSALFKNDGPNEFAKLKGRVELVGADGTIVAVNSVTFLDTHNGAMRPGDLHAISSTIKSKPGVTQARFIIEMVDSVPAPPESPALIPVKLFWDIPQPPSVKLDFFERKTKVGNPKTAIAGLAYFQTEWELRNVGEQTLRNLKLEYRLIATDDKLIDSATTMVTYPSTPAISPGENRVVFGIKQIKVDNFARYELHVIEAE
jgi:hypothetical protein